MAYRKLLVSWCVSARTSGIFASSKQTTSIANPMGLTVLFSGLPASGLPGRFHHPLPGWPEPARHGASALCLGAVSSSQQVLQGDYWVQIPGTVHRQTSIQIRYRSNFAVPVSQMSSVMQQENRAGATMTPALNQRPWSTSRRFTPIRLWAGGLIRMIPAFGLRSSGVPEFPAGPLRGQCAVAGPAGTADSVAWEWIPEPGWPWGEAGAPVDPLPPDPAHPGFGRQA